MDKPLNVELEDGVEVELSYHQYGNGEKYTYWVDIEQFFQNGYSYLSKKDLEIILDKINELEKI